MLRRPARALFAVLQPLTLALPLLAIGRMRRTPVIFNVQDLHPDAMVSTGLVRNRHLIALLHFMERTAYRNADRLAVICDGFRRHCVARGADPSRVTVIPNWIDLDEVRPQRAPSPLREKLGVDERSLVVLYAGTIGLASGAEVLLDAVAGLPDDAGIEIAFVGEGQLVPRLKAIAADRGLARVHFLPFQPRARLNDVQSLGDVSIVTLAPGHGRTSVPSKVLGYMAAGRPIVASVDLDSETASLIRAAGAGWVVSPGDGTSLREALCRARDDAAERRRRGELGRRYLEQHHGQASVLTAYSDLLRQVVT
jgi:colanic acid biosynthesis glycosyl transferase WcaI